MPQPEWMQGAPLPTAPGSDRERVLCEWDSQFPGYGMHLRSIYRDGWLCTAYEQSTVGEPNGLEEFFAATGMFGGGIGPMSSVVYEGTEGELYNVDEDPHQWENRWDDPACQGAPRRSRRRPLRQPAEGADRPQSGNPRVVVALAPDRVARFAAADMSRWGAGHEAFDDLAFDDLGSHGCRDHCRFRRYRGNRGRRQSPRVHDRTCRPTRPPRLSDDLDVRTDVEPAAVDPRRRSRIST